jgi:hypothetical protein
LKKPHPCNTSIITNVHGGSGLDAAITNAFATHTVRPMEFGDDMGTLAVTKAIAESCHSMQTSL